MFLQTKPRGQRGFRKQDANEYWGIESALRNLSGVLESDEASRAAFPRDGGLKNTLYLLRLNLERRNTQPAFRAGVAELCSLMAAYMHPAPSAAVLEDISVHLSSRDLIRALAFAIEAFKDGDPLPVDGAPLGGHTAVVPPCARALELILQASTDLASVYVEAGIPQLLASMLPEYRGLESSAGRLLATLEASSSST